KKRASKKGAATTPDPKKKKPAKGFTFDHCYHVLKHGPKWTGLTAPTQKVRTHPTPATSPAPSNAAAQPSDGFNGTSAVTENQASPSASIPSKRPGGVKKDKEAAKRSKISDDMVKVLEKMAQKQDGALEVQKRVADLFAKREARAALEAAKYDEWEEERATWQREEREREREAADDRLVFMDTSTMSAA
ncbi:No apical meristem-associated, C-terminal domain-containing protein, partial [Blyttiomyces helicus]